MPSKPSKRPFTISRAAVSSLAVAAAAAVPTAGLQGDFLGALLGQLTSFLNAGSGLPI